MHRTLPLLLLFTLLPQTATAAHFQPGSAPADGHHAPAYLAPPSPPPNGRLGGGIAWYVSSRVPYAALYNTAGDQAHIQPLFLAAVALQESAWNTTAERWAGGLDNSCGLWQIIIANITYYTGITDAMAACRWEEVPANTVTLGVRMMKTFEVDSGGVQPPLLWACWNSGPASCISPYYGQFLNNYYYVVNNFAASAPIPRPAPKPTPKPFAWKTWCSYRWSHGERCPGVWSHHHLTWPASIFYARPRLGGFVRSAWYRHGHYNVYTYRHGRSWAWPRYHAYKISVS